MIRTRNFLRRYTDLPTLIQMLRDRAVTFLDPNLWDDKNDAYFMELYKDKKKLKTLLALCCSEATETYHHWRVFSGGPSGVCVSFQRNALMKHLTSPSVRHGEVKYLKIKDLQGPAHAVDDLPFIKRSPYEPECEFRFIYQSRTEQVHLKSFDISLACIDSITLSPWMPGLVAESVRSHLKDIWGTSRLRVKRSTLVSNEQWRDCGDEIVRREARG